MSHEVVATAGRRTTLYDFAQCSYVSLLSPESLPIATYRCLRLPPVQVSVSSCTCLCPSFFRTTLSGIVRYRATSYVVARPSHNLISDHKMMSASRQPIVIKSYDLVRRCTTFHNDCTIPYDPRNRRQFFYMSKKT
jgi:hypothetical protein